MREGAESTMQVTIKCPRCDQDNARAVQHCWACGEWLHGRSPVVGVCPACRLPVRETELICSNCGRDLEPRLSADAAPCLPEETRFGARASKAIVRHARGPVRMLSPSLVCNLVGVALLVVAAARGLMALQGYRQALTVDEALFTLSALVLWSALGIVGLIMLIAGVFILRVRR